MAYGDMMTHIQQFLATKDAAKAAGMVKDTDKLVAGRIPELSADAAEWAKRQKEVKGG